MSDNRDHLRGFHEAYVEVTGIAVSLDFARRQAWRECDRRGLTAGDVRAVMRQLKRLVESTDTRYTDSSLLFENAVGKGKDIGKFESRALLLRKRRQKTAPTSAPAAAPVQPSEEDQERIRAAARVQSAALKAQLRGGAAE